YYGRLRRKGWKDLQNTSFPAVVSLRDGTFATIVNANADRVVIAHQMSDSRVEMSHGAFDAIWDKRFVQISHDPKVRNTRFGWLQSPGRLGSILRALRLPRIPSASR